MFKRLLSIALIFILLISMGSVTLAEPGDTPRITRQEFENQIKEQVNSASSNDRVEVLEEYNKYHSLSETDKDKFIKFLNDPTLMEEIIKSSRDNSLQLEPSFNEKKKSKIYEISDDIKIDYTLQDKLINPTDITPIVPLATVETRTATYTQTTTALGIKIFESKATMDYQRTGYGGTITKILNSEHRITRNLTLNRVSFGSNRHYRSSTRATSQAYVTISFLVKGDTWAYGDGESEISVTNYGVVTGNLWATFN